MLTEEKQIFDLFDEFYLIDDEMQFQPVKGKEIPKITNTEFVFKGTNKKKMVFVHQDKGQLAEKDRLMIENLVTKAIGWSMDDIALLNLSQNTPATIQSIKDFFKPEQIIFWGCDEFLKANGIPQKHHEVLRGKEMKVLTVQPVSFYQTAELKKVLWQSIRALLELK